MPRGFISGLGIDWNFIQQEGFIVERGDDVIHQTGMRCTCNNEDMHSGMIEQEGAVPRRRKMFSCDICNGYGYIYRDPKKLTVLITGVRQSKNRIEAGFLVPGDCTMSPKPNDFVSGGDLVVFTWTLPISDGQVLVRGSGSMSDNSARNTKLNTDEDRLWYYATKPIWCEDENGNVYRQGDFTLNGSRVIKWLNTRMSPGTRYVLKYHAYVEWIVFTPPDIRVDNNRDLGTRAALRKRHIAIINEDPRVTMSDRMPFCTRYKSCL